MNIPIVTITFFNKLFNNRCIGKHLHPCAHKKLTNEIAG